MHAIVPLDYSNYGCCTTRPAAKAFQLGLISTLFLIHFSIVLATLLHGGLHGSRNYSSDDQYHRYRDISPLGKFPHRIFGYGYY